jgi:hypothetical protein
MLGGFGDARPRLAHRRRGFIQPFPQYRFERRHFGRKCITTNSTQSNHAEIAAHVTAFNRSFENPTIAQFWNPGTAAGRAALDAAITQQAQTIAYGDDYKLLMTTTIAVVPLLIASSLSRNRRAAKARIIHVTGMTFGPPVDRKSQQRVSDH